MIKFKMVQKGYRYESEDGTIVLEKDWYKVRTVETVHHCMDKYEERSRWNIYGLQDCGKNVVYSRPTLNEAKAFVRDYFEKDWAVVSDGDIIYTGSKAWCEECADKLVSKHGGNIEVCYVGY